MVALFEQAAHHLAGGVVGNGNKVEGGFEGQDIEQAEHLVEQGALVAIGPYQTFVDARGGRHAKDALGRVYEQADSLHGMTHERPKSLRSLWASNAGNNRNSTFAINPFVDGFFEWMGSREGQQCMEVHDVLWDLLEDVQLDAKQRQLIWPDAERLDLQQSIQRIRKLYPQRRRRYVLMLRPAWSASRRQRCKSFSSISSWASNFLRGWRSTPGTSAAQPATVLSCSRAVRDLLAPN